MSEHEYKPNSHRYKEEQASADVEKKKVEKVVKGAVKTKKKSELHKLTDVFVAEDVGTVKTYLVRDLLIPAIKNTILDLIVEGATIIFKGESGRTKKRSAGEYVSYRSYADRDRRDDERYSRTRHAYRYDDIILESRGEAEEVLACMDELIETYDQVTVADMYDLVGMTCSFTDNKYGWRNLRNAEVVRVRGGEYMLRLPKAYPLD